MPSLAVRKMGGSRSYLLLALNDRDRAIDGWRSGDGTDWVDQMLFGGMLKCAEHGYRMIFELVDTHSDNVEREIAAALSALHPDGVILIQPTETIRSLPASSVPRAFHSLGSVPSSTAPGSRCEWMTKAQPPLSLGHRRIGFITGRSDYALSAARLEGYRSTLEANRAADPALLATGDFTLDSGVRA